MSHLLALLRSKQTLISPGYLSQGIIYGANVLGLTYFLRQTWFIEDHVTAYELLRDRHPVEPADELNDILKEISKDAKDLVSENTEIKLFVTSGMKPTHFGTRGTVNGGFVGVPLFFNFKNEQDVADNILINNANSLDGMRKETPSDHCFLLSDKAKKYGIAREVLLINSMMEYVNGAIPFVASIIFILFYKNMYETYDIINKPLYKRILIYTAFVLVGLSLMRFLFRNVLQYYESEVEAMIAELGKDYIEGGIEYCTKELERNSMTVKVKNGKTTYSAFDILDVLYGMFCKGIAPRIRLEYLKQYGNQKEETNKYLTK